MTREEGLVYLQEGHTLFWWTRAAVLYNSSVRGVRLHGHSRTFEQVFECICMIYHNVLVYLMIVPQCISIISPEKSHCKSTPSSQKSLRVSKAACNQGHWECLCACAALRVFLAVHIGNNLFCYNYSYSQLEFSALELTYLHYCLVIKSSVAAE